MIRGAIAFGLVLRLDKSLPNREVIITTSLCLVIVTTLMFGSMMPILGKVLLPSGENKENDHGHGHKKKEKKKDEEGNELKNMNGSGSYENEDSVSVHEVLIHPNYEDQDQSIAVNKKKKNM